MYELSEKFQLPRLVPSDPPITKIPDRRDESTVECCHLGCKYMALWAVYDTDKPVDNDTYSCNNHLWKMLSKRNYVEWIGADKPVAKCQDPLDKQEIFSV